VQPRGRVVLDGAVDGCPACHVCRMFGTGRWTGVAYVRVCMSVVASECVCARCEVCTCLCVCASYCVDVCTCVCVWMHVYVGMCTRRVVLARVKSCFCKDLCSVDGHSRATHIRANATTPL